MHYNRKVNKADFIKLVKFNSLGHSKIEQYTKEKLNRRLML